MNPALVIIDMQNWFFRSEDRREKLSELIESINQLIEVATTKNITIFQVLTIHKADKSTWNIVMKKHNFSALIEGSEEAKLLPEIKFDSSQEIIVKTRQSTFIRTNFEEKLKEKNIDLRAVNLIASVDVKSDEEAILSLKQFLNCDIRFFTRDEIATIEDK